MRIGSDELWEAIQLRPTSDFTDLLQL